MTEDGIYTFDGWWWVAISGESRTLLWGNRELLMEEIKQHGFTRHVDDGAVNWNNYKKVSDLSVIQAKKGDKMEYKIVNKITGEALYRHDPPKEDFREFVAEFGFYDVVGSELFDYIKTSGHTCWLKWLEERGFIEKGVWDKSKFTMTVTDHSVVINYDKHSILVLRYDGSMHRHFGVHNCGLPKEWFDEYGRLKIRGA